LSGLGCRTWARQEDAPDIATCLHTLKEAE
jgi:hypothetical protein